MSLAEVLDAARALPKDERLRLVHTLINEIGKSSPMTGQQESALLASLLPLGAEFEIATPLDCFEAAATLQQLLDAEKQRG